MADTPKKWPADFGTGFPVTQVPAGGVVMVTTPAGPVPVPAALLATDAQLQAVQQAMGTAIDRAVEIRTRDIAERLLTLERGGTGGGGTTIVTGSMEGSVVTQGVAASFAATWTGISTVWACLEKAGVLEGARTRLTQPGQVNLTPATAGADYRGAIYTAETGGQRIARSAASTAAAASTGGGTTPTPTPVTLPTMSISPASRSVKEGDLASGDLLATITLSGPLPSGVLPAPSPNDGRVVLSTVGSDNKFTVRVGVTASGVSVTDYTIGYSKAGATNTPQEIGFRWTIKAATPQAVVYPLDDYESLTPGFGPVRRLKSGPTKAAQLTRGSGGPTLDTVPQDGFKGYAALDSFFGTGTLATFTQDGATWTYNSAAPVRITRLYNAGGPGEDFVFPYANAPQLIRSASGIYAMWFDTAAVYGMLASFFPAGGFEKLILTMVMVNSSTLKGEATGKVLGPDNSAILAFSPDGDDWLQGHLDRDANSINAWRMLAGAGAGYLGSKRDYGYRVGGRFPVALGTPSVVQIGRTIDKKPLFRVNGEDMVTEAWSEDRMGEVVGQTSPQSLHLGGTPNGQRSPGLIVLEIYGTYDDTQDDKLIRRWGANSARALGMTTPDTEADLDAPPEPVPDPYEDPVVTELPAAARSNITTMRFANVDPIPGSYRSKPKRLLAFKRGDIPGARANGVRLTLAGSTVDIQQDQESYYNDGSLKVAAITARAFTEAGVNSPSMPIGCELGAPNRTANVSLAQLAANSDFKVRMTGHDLGTDVYEVSVNSIIQGGTTWPWGANPVQGYSVVASGQLRTEWCFWAMARRISDSGRHRWIKVMLWVEAFSATEFGIIGLIEQPNVTGANPNCTLGAAVQPKHIFTAELFDGSTSLCKWGGPSDPRVVSRAASAFNVSAQDITGSIGDDGTCWMVQPAAGGALPAGLPVNTPLFVGNAPYSGGTFRLATSRQGSVEQWDAREWVSGKQYGWAEDEGRILKADNVVWSVLSPQDGDPSTERAVSTIKPTGPGATFTEGSLTLYRVSAGPFTSQGSGNIEFVPLVSIYPNCGAVLCDLSTRGRIYVGSATLGRSVFIEPDLKYQLQESGITAPMDMAITYDASPTLAQANLGFYSPGAMMRFPRDLNIPGNSAGDERIGYMNHSAAAAFMRPTDVVRRIKAFDLAHHFAGYTLWMDDTLTGTMPALNNGHLRDGADYPGMKVRPKMTTFPFHGEGWVKQNGGYHNLAGYSERYQRPMDGTHLPMPAFGPYLLTADAIYLHQMVNEFSFNTASDYVPDAVVNGNTYHRVQAVKHRQAGRGIAWSVRTGGRVKHCFPAARPEAQFIDDVYLECARFIRAIIRTFSPARKAAGVYPVEINERGWLAPTIQLWMVRYAYLAIAVEAYSDEHPGWQTYIDFSDHFVIGCMDPLVDGGCGWLAPARQVYIMPQPAFVNVAAPDQPAKMVEGPGSEDSFYATWRGSWSETFRVYPKALTQGNGNEKPPTSQTEYTGCPTTGTLLEYEAIASGALAVDIVSMPAIAAWLGNPRGAALLAEGERRLNEANGGGDFRGRLKNHPEHCFHYQAA